MATPTDVPLVCPPVARPGSHPGTSCQEAPLEYSKTPFAELDAPRKIRSVKFSLMSPTEIGKCGVFHVFERNLYQMPQRVPLPNGILVPVQGHDELVRTRSSDTPRPEPTLCGHV